MNAALLLSLRSLDPHYILHNRPLVSEKKKAGEGKKERKGADGFCQDLYSGVVLQQIELKTYHVLTLCCGTFSSFSLEVIQFQIR